MKKRCVLAALASAALLGAHGRAQARTIEGPLAAQPPNAAQRGQVAFDRICKSCHGSEGRGDAGPRLVPFSRDYEELLGIVREGQGQMPPISVRELPDADVALIVAYLKSLSH